jgi:DNA oxidative demethylase
VREQLELGRPWDAVRGRYGATPAPLPVAVVDVAVRAGAAAMAVSPVGCTGQPDVCVVNLYPTPASALSLHVERESRGAVVSVSLGDACDFVFKNTWDKHAPLHTVRLESGDVLVFGGRARGIVHGVSRVWPGTAPPLLQGLFPGRINLNIRER